MSSQPDAGGTLCALTDKESEELRRSDARYVVYYDGACPRCVRDRERYERWAGESGEAVAWFDITGQEEALRAMGVDPQRALLELHVCDRQGRIYRELDAYRVLMQPIPRLRPLAWLIGLPLIRPALGWLYRGWVKRRLARQGRLD